MTDSMIRRIVRIVLTASFCLPRRPSRKVLPAPPARIFHDPAYHLSFDYPANWNFLPH